MWFGLIGFIIGILFGAYLPLAIPVEYARYTAVGIIGILDSILGAVRADLQRKYSLAIFGSGLIANMLLAMIITYIGDKLGLDLYLAILVAFTIRILNNAGIIRYHFLTRFLGKEKIKEELKNSQS